MYVRNKVTSVCKNKIAGLNSLQVRLSVLLFVNKRYSFNSLQIKNKVSIVYVLEIKFQEFTS